MLNLWDVGVNRPAPHSKSFYMWYITKAAQVDNRGIGVVRAYGRRTNTIARHMIDRFGENVIPGKWYFAQKCMTPNPSFWTLLKRDGMVPSYWSNWIRT